ncbi:MAG: hypothetical protein IPG84_11650 [Betaproteobacteria bacterium]|nr:hypothetical protein [Betaproteobacteria bacterium]
MRTKQVLNWLCAIAFAVAPGVEAGTRFFTAGGVVFDDGARASGAFLYDDVTHALVGWNVSVEGGGDFLPFAYMPGDSTGKLNTSPVPMVVFKSAEAGIPTRGAPPRRNSHHPVAAARRRRVDPDRPGRRRRLGQRRVPQLPAGRRIVAGALLETSSPALAFLSEAIEFYHAGFDHYFLTANGDEILALDTGYFKGWARTGEKIRVFEAGSFNEAPVRPVCRYYGLPSAGLDSHFYSAIPAECYRVNRDFGTEWQVESGNVFQVALPDRTTGDCPIAGVPVYRLFNHRPDANHRYTTKSAIRTQMEAAGWIREGYGPDAVIMCALPPPLD